MTAARTRLLLGCAALAGLLAAPLAHAGELAPYRALYHLSLASAKSGSGVVAAGGAVLDEWGETCDGWTEQERFLMRLQYAEQGDEKIRSNLVSWEAKNGLRYRFDERRENSGEDARQTSDGDDGRHGPNESAEEVRGEAKLDGAGKGGTAEFTRPEAATLSLPSGVLFPTEHTLLLIARAKAGDQLVTRKLFDGSDVANAAQITAFIGPEIAAPGAKDAAGKSPLLDRPSWRIRLAFFALPGRVDGLPDYQETIQLLDNGVIAEMLFDYGDYVIRAKLDDIEALPRPTC
jgi:hypothetical protein